MLCGAAVLSGADLQVSAEQLTASQTLDLLLTSPSTPPPPSWCQVSAEQLTASQALNLLRQHLSANLVKLGRCWHYQARGIAQGSTLSTLLCRWGGGGWGGGTGG